MWLFAERVQQRHAANVIEKWVSNYILLHMISVQVRSMRSTSAAEGLFASRHQPSVGAKTRVETLIKSNMNFATEKYFAGIL